MLSFTLLFISMATLEEDEEEDEEEEDEGSEGKKKTEPKIHGESHTSYLMKAYCYPGIGNWYLQCSTALYPEAEVTGTCNVALPLS